MLKLNILVTLRSDLSIEAFRTYWREKHGPFVGRICGREAFPRAGSRKTVSVNMNSALLRSTNFISSGGHQVVDITQLHVFASRLGQHPARKGMVVARRGNSGMGPSRS
jgi:hypothetical protein